MAHIDLPEGLPGIRALYAFRPETARPLAELVQTLLRGDSSLSAGDRELIAAYVSSLNECVFCEMTHGACAAVYLHEASELLDAVKRDLASAPVSRRLRALLSIAGKVQAGGLHVTTEDAEAARSAGATDVEIHDAVLIAAAFCMLNRYVDGLGTPAPRDPALYAQLGRSLTERGYAPL